MLRRIYRRWRGRQRCQMRLRWHGIWNRILDFQDRRSYRGHPVSLAWVGSMAAWGRIASPRSRKSGSGQTKAGESVEKMSAAFSTTLRREQQSRGDGCPKCRYRSGGCSECNPTRFTITLSTREAPFRGLLPDETRIQELPSEMSGIFLAYRVKDLGRQNRGPGGLAAEDPWHTPLMTRAFQKPEP